MFKLNIVTLEFEIKTSPKIYSYLKRYINSGIKFKNCLSWEFNHNKARWNKCRGPQNAYLGFTEKWIKWIIEKNWKKFYKLERVTASTRVCNECKASDSFLKYKEINGIKNTLSIREFNCPYCGKLLDRDVNAARNIRDWGYEDLVSNY